MNQIVRNVIAARKLNSLKMDCTHKRRILFNPNHPLSFQQKMYIVTSTLGAERSQKTLESIYETLENWDYKTNGKITQKKVATLMGRSIATIKRYWHNFEDFAKYLSK